MDRNAEAIKARKSEMCPHNTETLESIYFKLKLSLQKSGFYMVPSVDKDDKWSFGPALELMEHCFAIFLCFLTMSALRAKLYSRQRHCFFCQNSHTPKELPT